MSSNNNNGVAIVRLDSTHLRLVSGVDGLTGIRTAVLVSYDTPIAYRLGDDPYVYTTTTNWSRTTNGHRQRASAAFGLGYGDTKPIGQDCCDRALHALVGDTRLADSKPTTLGRKVDTRDTDYAKHTGIGDASLVVPVTRTRRSRAW